SSPAGSISQRASGVSTATNRVTLPAGTAAFRPAMQFPFAERKATVPASPRTRASMLTFHPPLGVVRRPRSLQPPLVRTEQEREIAGSRVPKKCNVGTMQDLQYDDK